MPASTASCAWRRKPGTTPARLALAWLLSRPGIDAVIVGATRPEQVKENAGAADVVVDAALAKRIEEAFR